MWRMEDARTRKKRDMRESLGPARMAIVKDGMEDTDRWMGRENRRCDLEFKIQTRKPVERV